MRSPRSASSKSDERSRACSGTVDVARDQHRTGLGAEVGAVDPPAEPLDVRRRCKRPLADIDRRREDGGVDVPRLHADPRRRQRAGGGRPHLDDAFVAPGEDQRPRERGLEHVAALGARVRDEVGADEVLAVGVEARLPQLDGGRP